MRQYNITNKRYKRLKRKIDLLIDEELNLKMFHVKQSLVIEEIRVLEKENHYGY